MPSPRLGVKTQPPLQADISIAIARLCRLAYDRRMVDYADSLSLRRYPDPALRAEAQPVAEVTDEVRRVASRMIELMHEHQGVGLAGPQVGLDWRLFVANLSGEPGEDRVFINPVLSDPARQTEARDEGCLSLPRVEGEITRPSGITIDAVDDQGEPFQMWAEGLLARVWQHENDHLDGVLIIDRMPLVDRQANRRVLRELEAK